MTARFVLASAALLLVSPLVAVPLRAQDVAYRAGTNHYRFTASIKQTQTTPAGNQDLTIDSRQQLTVNLAQQAKDTLVATITLDSISVTTPLGSPNVSGLMGAKFISYVSPTGKVYSTRKPEGNDPTLASLTEGLSHFLPAYRANLKAGMTWSDTASGKVTQQGIDMDRTLISNFKVLGDTTIGAERAYRISREQNVKATGRGSLQGQPIALETTGTSSGVFYLSPKGVFLGARQNDDSNTRITLLARGDQVSLKQQAQSRIEPIDH